ncbi:Gfo/Idh/MocA family protein [Fictibacillus phosphorivorans]|uniref:Gfo/Idh/MocA family protein n=1 Tax=Fictibacillus phosphorivorans TaxID=1221500 RepID=UPI00203BB321|nr:Gfo/Idh/MocA family oxidoreductase [Fictibacillus phosphorivorans]MCM3720244.1 Gfo/Idh/MocA family oxidoreductase [Fictibacillus phosphorivorans]MCM3777911.1 Gfo/Idh/MocA family oxidoreductase [Fictibacillus phosphorivorans]
MNVALLSKWHVHANDYAREANENESISIKMVWDEDPKRGAEWAHELQVPFEPNLEQVLSNPEIDGVIVTTTTNRHKDVIIAAANHGKHIFTEKVLAFTVEECEEIYRAVEENQVHLMVNLPRLTESFYLYAQETLDKGLLGDITYIRCRVAHNGSVPSAEHPKGWLPEHFYHKEECGGGALIDLGAHPIYLTNRLGGKVKAVTGKLNEFYQLGVDDNAVVMVEYESGAMGMIETGFLSFGSPQQLELYGTEGTLMIEGENVRIKSKHLNAGEWITPEKLPEPIHSAMEQWREAIQKGKKPSITKEDVLNLTAINQAAAASNKEGRRILLSQLGIEQNV